MELDSNEIFLSVSDVSRILKIHTDTVIKMIRRKKIRAYNISVGIKPHWKIKKSELLEDITNIQR